MTIQFDRLNRLVPPGKVVRKLEEGFFLGGALPSWLQVSQGTASYPSLATNGQRGGLTVTSGATNGNQAKLETAFQIDLRNVAGVLWEAQGLVCSAGTGLDIGMGVGGAGGFVRQTSSLTYAETNLNNVTTAADYSIRTSDIPGHTEAQRSRNLSLLFINKYENQPTNGENWIYLYVLEDDQVMIRRQGLLGLGTMLVRPDLSVTTRENVAKSFTVQKLALTVFTD